MPPGYPEPKRDTGSGWKFVALAESPTYAGLSARNLRPDGSRQFSSWTLKLPFKTLLAGAATACVSHVSAKPVPGPVKR
jgi:hypothetical protein